MPRNPLDKITEEDIISLANQMAERQIELEEAKMNALAQKLAERIDRDTDRKIGLLADNINQVFMQLDDYLYWQLIGAEKDLSKLRKKLLKAREDISELIPE